MWLPAIRRMLKLFLIISGGTIVLSALFGLLLQASLVRSIAIGFYLVGCFVLFGAFFFGNRGPIRSRSPHVAGPRKRSRRRRSTAPPSFFRSASCSSSWVSSGTTSTRCSDH